MIIPKYMTLFKCIGGACEDNCCIGWDVDIDKTTYLKYKNVSHPQMKRELEKYIHINEDVYDESVNYAFAVLNTHKECSFLNADRLCMIQKHLGESYLSNVCSNFPRMTHKIDAVVERSATPSCPEIARLLLLDPEAMTFVETPTPKALPLLTYKIKQKDPAFRNSLVSSLMPIRNACLSMVHGVNTSIEVDLKNIGILIDRLMKLERTHQLAQTQEVIDTFMSDLQRNTPLQAQPNHLYDDTQMASMMTFSEEIKEVLIASGISDSKRFVEFNEMTNTAVTENGIHKYEQFTSTHPYFLKNLFANHIFKGLFPFSEGDNPEEAYWLLLSRFALIKGDLIRLASNQEFAFELSEIVGYVQSFSKVIEHHKHFEDSVIKHFKKNHYKISSMIKRIL